MHTEKNMGEALFGTLFDTDKGKDNVKARVDQESLCNRKSLNMRQPKGNVNVKEYGKKWVCALFSVSCHFIISSFVHAFLVLIRYYAFLL